MSVAPGGPGGGAAVALPRTCGGMIELGGAKGAGRSLSRGWERALCREEAECPPQGESPVTRVWRSAVEGAPPSTPAPLVFYSSITKTMGKQAVSEQHSTYHPVSERAGGLRVSKCDNN